MNLDNAVANCYGVICIKKSANFPNIEEDEVVIVEANNGKNVGFPKGKRNKIKKLHRKENIFEGSSRELFEETGIKFNNLDILDNFFIKELSRKGIVSVIYLVGIFIEKDHEFVYDTTELTFSGWRTVSKALNTVTKNRKEVLQVAYNKIADNKTNTFTNGANILNDIEKNYMSQKNI